MKIKTKQDMETYGRLTDDLDECKEQFDRLYNDRLVGDIGISEYEKYRESYLSAINTARRSIDQFVADHK